jgi:hypothetical protein
MNVRALAAAFVLFAATPCAAQDNALLGTWEIVEAQPAPWLEDSKRAAAMAEAKRLLKQVVTFTPKEVVSRHKALACRRAEYEETDYEADALFQGNLPEPNPTAAALRLGFKRGEVPGVDLKCSTGAYSYHFRDRNTALTAFSNVIYTLKRM